MSSAREKNIRAFVEFTFLLIVSSLALGVGLCLTERKGLPDPTLPDKLMHQVFECALSNTDIMLYWRVTGT